MGLGSNARNMLVNNSDVSPGNPLDITGSVTANVNVNDSNAVTYYNEASAVPAMSETTVVSVTVPTGKSMLISGGMGSAMVDTEFNLYIDGSKREKERTAWTQRNVLFSIKEYVGAGKIVKITAIHNNSSAQNFAASIVTYLS